MASQYNIHAMSCLSLQITIPCNSKFRGILGRGDSTYTAVVDDLNDGSELASVGATADQDEAANLDQLPGSDFDIDIGHGGILYTKSLSAHVRENSRANTLTVDNRGLGGESGGLLSKKVGLSKLRLRNSDVPTHFSLNRPLAAAARVGLPEHPQQRFSDRELFFFLELLMLLITVFAHFFTDPQHSTYRCNVQCMT